MPTNVSTPIWRCDVCGHRFDADKEAAERCESAGPPFILPPGTLMLDYESRHLPASKPGFVLRPLFVFSTRMGTLAATHHKRTGHTITYALDLDPALHWDAERRYYRWPSNSEPRQVDSGNLWPNRAGLLQLHGNRWFGHHAGTVDHADPQWVFDAVGLDRGPLDPGTDMHQMYWARPLTPEIRAVLDALYAYPRFIHERPEVRKHVDGWLLNNRLGSLALGTVGVGKPTADGPANVRRAMWYLRGADEERLVARINAMWREWRGGSGRLAGGGQWDTCEPGTYDVPAPRLVSTKDHLTASKLTKELRALVAATGVEWPARTNATDYCNILLDKLLEYRVDTESTLFAGATVVSVRGRKGGVGKSTVAAALARRLAQAGRRVVLVDFDLAGPSQHLIHNLAPGVDTDTERVMIRPSETCVPGLRVFSPGQVFPPGALTQWSETCVGQWVDFVGSSLDLGDAEIVVLDMPPGESRVHSMISDHRSSRLDAEVHVTTGHPLALADIERDLVGEKARPRTRCLVENMSRITGRDGAGVEHELRLHGVTEDAPALAERTGTEWAGSLPWAPDVADLAGCDEIARLAELLAADLVATS